MEHIGELATQEKEIRAQLTSEQSSEPLKLEDKSSKSQES